MPTSDPRQIITQLVLVGLDWAIRGWGVRIGQSGSDFNEGCNNLAGSSRTKWQNIRILIGQIACQSNSLRMVNCIFILHNYDFISYSCYVQLCFKVEYNLTL